MKLEIADIESMDEDTIQALGQRLGLTPESLRSHGPKRTEPYPLKEAAKAVGWGQNTMRRRVKAGLVGRVPHVTRLLIPAHEVERLQRGEEPEEGRR